MVIGKKRRGFREKSCCLVLWRSVLRGCNHRLDKIRNKSSVSALSVFFPKRCIGRSMDRYVRSFSSHYLRWWISKDIGKAATKTKQKHHRDGKSTSVSEFNDAALSSLLCLVLWFSHIYCSIVSDDQEHCVLFMIQCSSPEHVWCSNP